VYVIIIGGIFFILVVVNVRLYIESFIQIIFFRVFQYFIYSKLNYRYRYLGSWSSADILLYLFYITVNAFYIDFKFSNIQPAGLQAVNFLLINMIFLFVNLHFNFLAIILGIPLNVYRRTYYVGKIISIFFIFHALIVIATRTAFPLRIIKNIWGIIISHLSFPFLKVNA
jgi:hypothetical protein